MWFLSWLHITLITGAANAQPMTATEFEAAALTFRAATVKQWKVTAPASPASWRRGCRDIEAACAWHWLDEGPRYWIPLLILAYTENGMREQGNPKDPSYNRWGTTVDDAREVSRWLCIPVPASDRALVHRLQVDGAFAALITAGELKLCLRASNGRLERAIVRYKLGRHCDLGCCRAQARLAHWRRIRAAWTWSLQHARP